MTSKPVQKVLLVDDDGDTRELMQLFLEDRCFEVQTASNGSEALSRLETWTPDVILLDLNMPIMNGWQFLEIHEMRKGAQHPIPVIVASGEAVHPKSASVVATVFKPYDPDKITELLQLSAHKLPADRIS